MSSVPRAPRTELLRLMAPRVASAQANVSRVAGRGSHRSVHFFCVPSAYAVDMQDRREEDRRQTRSGLRNAYVLPFPSSPGGSGARARPPITTPCTPQGRALQTVTCSRARRPRRGSLRTRERRRDQMRPRVRPLSRSLERPLRWSAATPAGAPTCLQLSAGILGDRKPQTR